VAILASEIIAFGRTTSDLKSSRFLLDDPDLLGFLNDLISELYDMFVIEREGYFQTSAILTVVNGVAALPTDFYKEISLWSGTTSNPIPIKMLDSYIDRFSDCGAWISAKNVQFFPVSNPPANPVNIDYIPVCPVLAVGTAIPTEFEKFVEWLKVGLTIKIIDARKQQVSASMDRTFKRLTDRITKMATARKASPRVPAIPDSEKRNGFWWNRRNRFPYP
jgi:hypothetical protein